MIAISTAIFVAAALYFARSIFAPFAFALFMMAIVWPMQSILKNKLPHFVALFLDSHCAGYHRIWSHYRLGG